jgi:hypothetical protein
VCRTISQYWKRIHYILKGVLKRLTGLVFLRNTFRLLHDGQEHYCILDLLQHLFTLYGLVELNDCLWDFRVVLPRDPGMLQALISVESIELFVLKHSAEEVCREFGETQFLWIQNLRLLFNLLYVIILLKMLGFIVERMDTS